MLNEKAHTDITDEELKAELALRDVVTLAEAAMMWNKAPKTIQMQVLKGRIAGRQAGRIWLLYVSDIVRRYGQPERWYTE